MPSIESIMSIILNPVITSLDPFFHPPPLHFDSFLIRLLISSRLLISLFINIGLLTAA